MTALGEYIAEDNSTSAPISRKTAKQRPDRLGPQIATSNVGYQLLQKAGWQEGQGIGANQQGRPVPLAAYHQQARQGIGANAAAESVSTRHKRPGRQAKSTSADCNAGESKQKGAQPVPDVPEEPEVKRQRHQQVRLLYDKSLATCNVKCISICDPTTAA